MNYKQSSLIYRLLFIVYSYLKLIRPLNLIIIVFAQYMVRYAFMQPIYKAAGFNLQLDKLVFGIFSIAFVCMAAGGYIINDFYDVEIDKINKPDKLIISRHINPKNALVAYWVFSLASIIMGCWASWRAGLPAMSLLFFIYLGGLWFYSTTLKYQPLVGNIIVALFLALVPLAAGIIELYGGMQNHLFEGRSLNLKHIFYGIAGISLFAFLSSLAREIAKDMEDVKGDMAKGCRTLPIVLGQKTAGRAVEALCTLIFVLLVGLQYEEWKVRDMISMAYVALFIQLPIIWIVVKMDKAATQQQLHKVSNWIKVLMVLGISYLFVWMFVLNMQYGIE